MPNKDRFRFPRARTGLRGFCGCWPSLPFALFAGACIALNLPCLAAPADSAAEPFRQRLKILPFKIAYESYVNTNWEIFAINADGSEPVNLTNTPNEQEHYPQVSPDGTKICFSADEGEGRETIRSLWVMDADGRHRKKIADYAREPFWGPDSKLI